MRRRVLLRLFGERIALRFFARDLAALLSAATLLALLLGASLFVGSLGSPAAGPLDALWGTDPALAHVVWELRLPRALVAALAGAMFAVSGAALQAATRNGLADPSLVGVSQGAAFAVVFLTVALPAAPPGLVPVAAFAGSAATAALVHALNGLSGPPRPLRFVLLGIGVAALASAGTSVLMTYGEIDRVLAVLSWLAGSINGATLDDARLLAVCAALFVAPLLRLSRATTALRLGEASATALGVGVAGLRAVLVLSAVGLAATATAVVGPLGFVGLIAPHAAARLSRPGTAVHLLLTAIGGALLVGAADLLGRSSLVPVQLPAGLVTAIVGAPAFLLLLRRRTGAGAAPARTAS